MRSKQMQEDILKLMKETVSRPTDLLKHQVSKRCQALASFMETLMDEVTRPDLKLDLPQESELTGSERDSVMLGEISPHHDYYDSKSSSETPPSYTQLNYNDNLLRFFNSRPKTLNTLEDEIKLEGSSEMSPNQRFDSSGDSRSAENCSSGSNHLTGSATTSNTGTGCSSYSAYAPPTLTEATLVRHNDDMEKGMVKKHKEQRCSVRNFNGEKSKKQAAKEGQMSKDAAHVDLQSGHGVKRSGSRSWEADTKQNHKHQHMSENHAASITHASGCRATDAQSINRHSMLGNIYPHVNSLNSPELWPPFSLSGPVCSTQSHSTTNPQMLPGRLSAVYTMLPTSHLDHVPHEHPGPQPPKPEPYYMSSYAYPPTHPLTTSQPLVNIPLHKIAPLHDVLVSNTNTFAGKFDFVSEVAKPSDSEPSGVSLQTHSFSANFIIQPNCTRQITSMTLGIDSESEGSSLSSFYSSFIKKQSEVTYIFFC